MKRYLIVAAAALLALGAPAAMAQSHDRHRGDRHSAQRGHGNSSGHGYNSAMLIGATTIAATSGRPIATTGIIGTIGVTERREHRRDSRH